MSALPEADRERLRQHFLSENTPDKWEELWGAKFSPWDRGVHNPALFDILTLHQGLFGESFSEASDGRKVRKRALVPGCGRGYDVMLLASFGYDAVGVDGSETAIKAAKKLRQDALDKYPLQTGVQERGNMTFICDDFFSKSWESEAGCNVENAQFDIIYDYTVGPGSAFPDTYSTAIVLVRSSPVEPPSLG
jgi:methyl halide transferase